MVAIPTIIIISIIIILSRIFFPLLALQHNVKILTRDQTYAPCPHRAIVSISTLKNLHLIWSKVDFFFF